MTYVTRDRVSRKCDMLKNKAVHMTRINLHHESLDEMLEGRQAVPSVPNHITSPIDVATRNM